jgi:hypothetical protein
MSWGRTLLASGGRNDHMGEAGCLLSPMAVEVRNPGAGESLLATPTASSWLLVVADAADGARWLQPPR